MATYKCVINDGESNRLVIENITHIAERIFENKFKLSLTIGLDQVNHLEHLKWLYDHLENGNIRINNIKVYAELQKDFVIPSEPNILDQNSESQIPDENNSTVMPTEPIINKESEIETESQPAMNSESEINQAIQSYNETEEKLLQEYTVFNRVQNISIAADSYDYGVFKANIELLSSPINEV